MKKFTKEELHHVYKTLNSRGKSCDGFSPNDLKILEGLTIKPMVEIFNEVLDKGEFPKTWLVAKVLFLHKSGNWRELANFRSIHIQQAMPKLFNKATAKRLNKFLEDHQILNSSQFACRKNLGTTGALTILQQLVKQALDAKGAKKLYTAFVDFHKAFDGIERSLLSRKLKNFGLPARFVDLVINIFNKIEMDVATKSKIDGRIKSNIGVLQGDPLSCLFFNCFLADLAQEFDGMGPTLKRT